MITIYTSRRRIIENYMITGDFFLKEFYSEIIEKLDIGVSKEVWIFKTKVKETEENVKIIIN